jgi:hypothetical protein
MPAHDLLRFFNQTKPGSDPRRLREMIAGKAGIRSDREHGQGQAKGKAHAKRI